MLGPGDAAPALADSERAERAAYAGGVAVRSGVEVDLVGRLELPDGFSFVSRGAEHAA